MRPVRENIFIKAFIKLCKKIVFQVCFVFYTFISYYNYKTISLYVLCTDLT